MRWVLIAHKGDDPEEVARRAEAEINAGVPDVTIQIGRRRLYAHGVSLGPSLREHVLAAWPEKWRR